MVNRKIFKINLTIAIEADSKEDAYEALINALSAEQLADLISKNKDAIEEVIAKQDHADHTLIN
ncbi:MAG: hypothetical protein PHI41_07990 [Erysipelotrichaceae bacterium]|nr:hypothetical protein [Erysipelotrichaceae bacterium]